MKKLYSLFLLLAGILCFTSCDDDYKYVVPDSLEFTKADLYFKSDGGTGSLEVNSNRGLKATSSVEWCTVNVSGGLITANVIENSSIESRTGTITVDDGVLTALVPVYQEGLSFTVDMSTLKVSDNGSNSTFVTVHSTSPYMVTIPSDATSWLSYVDDGGKITFNIEPNTTGAIRGTGVMVKSGSRTIIVPIGQYEIDDLVGGWTAEYVNKSGVSSKEQIQVTKPEDGILSFTLKAPSILSTALVFNCTYEDGLVKIINASSIGTYFIFGLYSVIVSQDGAISWDPAHSYVGSPKVTEEGTFYIQFGDNGSWRGYVAAGLGAQAFTSSSLSSDTNAGNAAIYYNLRFRK